MTMLRPVLHLRRERLLAAVRGLSAQEAATLVLLLTQACPTTGRIWTSASRLADDLKVSSTLVETLLDTLELRGHLRSAPARGSIRTLELGPVFVRDAEAPANLPVAPEL
jgi:DNA-binding MarR family transcriptional regulator